MSDPAPVSQPGAAVHRRRRRGASSSLDYEQTLRRVARLAVPDFADWCAVYILGDGRRGRGRGVQRPRGPGGRGDAARHPPRAARPRRRLGVARGRRVRQVDPRHRRHAVLAPTEEVDDRLYAGSRRGRTCSCRWLARGRALGALTLLSTREGRHYTRGRPRVRGDPRGAASRSRSTTRGCTPPPSARSALLDSFFATAPVGLAFVDHDLRFVRVNDDDERLQRAPRRARGRVRARAREPSGPRPARQCWSGAGANVS